MKCPNCGCEITQRFCSQCGTPAPAASPAPKPRKKHPVWIALIILLSIFNLAMAGGILSDEMTRKVWPVLFVGIIPEVLCIIGYICARYKDKAQAAISPPQVSGNPKSNIFPQPGNPGAFQTHTQRIDPEENIPTPSGAELTYLDAQALNFWNKKSTDYVIPPYYSESAFGRNVKPALQRLLNGGFLQVSGIEKSIGLKTVPELKSILAERGLKTSGKKAELIARIIDNLDPDELEELFPVGVYGITERGQRALEPYEIIRLNQEYGFRFSYYRLFELQKKFPQYSNTDILLKLTSEEIQKCYQSGSRSEYHFLLLSCAAMYKKSNNDLPHALECYVLSFFVWTYEMKQHDILNVETHISYIAKNIEECGIECGYSFPQLCKRFAETIQHINPFGLASQQTISEALRIFKQSLGVDNS
ncbi:MAG: hypothetical protein HFE45_03825 [Oscillospiraceae bacterium]|jgi:hypothetical protein|nr:hypothetical protein [Oscillospiraceae bacterium]